MRPRPHYRWLDQARYSHVASDSRRHRHTDQLVKHQAVVRQIGRCGTEAAGIGLSERYLSVKDRVPTLLEYCPNRDCATGAASHLGQQHTNADRVDGLQLSEQLEGWSHSVEIKTSRGDGNDRKVDSHDGRSDDPNVARGRIDDDGGVVLPEIA